MAPVALPQTAFAAEVVAAQGERQQAVVAQPVVVAEVLIPQRQPEQALGQLALQGMLAAAGVAVIDEAGGQAPGQADALVDSLQQQGATIGGHVLFFSLFQWVLPNYSMNSSGRCSNWFTTAGEN